MPLLPLRALGALLLILAPLHVSARDDVPATEPDEVTATGERIAAALNERDAPGFERLIDFERFSHHVVDGLDSGLSDSSREAFRRGLRDAGPKIATTTVRRLKDGNGVVRLLRAERRANDWDILLRVSLYDGEGTPAGFDYIQFELGDDQRIDDWISEAMAGQASAQVRLIAAMMFPESGLLPRLFGSSGIDENLYSLFKELRDTIVAMDNRKTYEVLGRMPDTVRATRFWATYRTAIASNLDEATYRDSLDHLAANFGEDRDLDFALVDHAWFRKDYAGAIRRLESFEKRVIEDGNTALLKCSAAFELRDFAKAVGFCRRSVSLEPELEDAWWALSGIAIEKQDAGLVIEALRGLETHAGFAFEPDALVATPEYAWLKGTPEFNAWRRGDVPKR